MNKTLNLERRYLKKKNEHFYDDGRWTNFAFKDDGSNNMKTVASTNVRPVGGCSAKPPVTGLLFMTGHVVVSIRRRPNVSPPREFIRHARRGGLRLRPACSSS